MVPFDETTPPDDARGHQEGRTAALVLQAQRGDQMALGRLVERSLAALTGFCRGLAATHDGAQDLVQETLLRAVVSLGRLQDPERFEAWLFGIAANVARKRWRRELRAPLSLDRAMAHPDAAWVTVKPLWEPPSGAGEWEARARAVEQALGALPGAARWLLGLRYSDGLSYAQIAATLGVPVSTVRGRLFRSRRRLRLALSLAIPLPAAGKSTRRGPRTEGPAMHTAAGSPEAERLIAAAEERIARAAAFYGHWFGQPVEMEGLADDAKGVIRRAAADAQRFGHNYVGTEHVLVGLVGDATSLPAAVLAERGVTLANVQELMQRRLGRGAVPVGSPMSLVPRVQTVVEMAFAEARRMDATAVGAEHLLLGLLREGCGVAALLIESLGADISDVRERVLAALADG